MSARSLARSRRGDGWQWVDRVERPEDNSKVEGPDEASTSMKLEVCRPAEAHELFGALGKGRMVESGEG
jgi:hypothetical protein